MREDLLDSHTSLPVGAKFRPVPGDGVIPVELPRSFNTHSAAGGERLATRKDPEKRVPIHRCSVSIRQHAANHVEHKIPIEIHGYRSAGMQSLPQVAIEHLSNARFTNVRQTHRTRLVR